MDDEGCCWNRIPIVEVPLRYWITLFAARMCWGDGFDWYCASMLVIVAISGLVDCESHWREPTNCCICRIRSGVAGSVGGSILSTGRPDWYGVFTELESLRLAIVVRVSMNAV